MVLPVRPPGFHTYVDAPFAVIAFDSPSQIGVIGSIVTVGLGLTVMFTGLKPAVLAQPLLPVMLVSTIE